MSGAAWRGISFIAAGAHFALICCHALLLCIFPLIALTLKHRELTLAAFCGIKHIWRWYQRRWRVGMATA